MKPVSLDMIVSVGTVGSNVIRLNIHVTKTKLFVFTVMCYLKAMNISEVEKNET